MIFKEEPGYTLLTDPDTILFYGDAIVSDRRPLIDAPELIVSELRGRKLGAAFFPGRIHRAVYRKSHLIDAIHVAKPAAAPVKDVNSYLPNLKHPPGWRPLALTETVMKGDYWHFEMSMARPANSSIGKNMKQYLEDNEDHKISGWPFRKVFNPYVETRRLPRNPIFSRPLPLP